LLPWKSMSKAPLPNCTELGGPLPPVTYTVPGAGWIVRARPQRKTRLVGFCLSGVSTQAFWACTRGGGKEIERRSTTTVSNANLMRLNRLNDMSILLDGMTAVNGGGGVGEAASKSSEPS
jgi:hypothetical protein